MILEKPSLERCSIWVTAFCAMLAVFLTLGALQLHASDQTESKPMRTKAWEFEFQSIGGDAFSLSEFEGKVVMVVNTASRCGFTNQYNELQALWDQFKGQKFILLGVPSNDFGQQEPGTESEIKSFCEINFNIDFPMTAKVSVVGDNAHPFYQWVSTQRDGTAVPKWNFHKLMIDREGNLVAAFPSATAPGDQKIKTTIERLLSDEESGPVD